MSNPRPVSTVVKKSRVVSKRTIEPPAFSNTNIEPEELNSEIGLDPESLFLPLKNNQEMALNFGKRFEFTSDSDYFEFEEDLNDKGINKQTFDVIERRVKMISEIFGLREVEVVQMWLDMGSEEKMIKRIVQNIA